MQTPSVNRYDVLIAGGAVIGSSVAYFLARVSANQPYAERGIV